MVGVEVVVSLDNPLWGALVLRRQFGLPLADPKLWFGELGPGRVPDPGPGPGTVPGPGPDPGAGPGPGPRLGTQRYFEKQFLI